MEENNGFENLNGQEDVSDVQPSEVFLETLVKTEESLLSVYGVTLLGRVHKQYGDTCQDYHLFADLGHKWHLYVVSDGAGSAKASNRGARTNCMAVIHLIKGLLERVDWQFRNDLPSELEWYQEFYAVCRQVKAVIVEKVESLDEHLKPKDFNATLLALIVTPCGMLSGHIGDGRMGYQTHDGNWHSIMTPHKGNEANQTVFVMNAWDQIKIPTLKMSGVAVPETVVCKSVPRAVVLLTDGCENFAWYCLQKNKETGFLEDRNMPFPGFFEPLIMSISHTIEENRLETFISFIDSSTEECSDEQDDRTLMIGLYVSKNNEGKDNNAE